MHPPAFDSKPLFYCVLVFHISLQGKEAFIQKTLSSRKETVAKTSDSSSDSAPPTAAIADTPPSTTGLTSDEMSVFYAEFLNRKWSDHLNFNIEWQKRNITIVFLSVLVGLENLVARRKRG